MPLCVILFVPKRGDFFWDALVCDPFCSQQERDRKKEKSFVFLRIKRNGLIFYAFSPFVFVSVLFVFLPHSLSLSLFRPSTRANSNSS